MIKKSWKRLCVLLALCMLVFSCMAYAVLLKRAESVYLGKSFYFLVHKTEHIEAGAYDVRLDGGAGYLLEYDGKEYVAFAVYLSERDGISVQTGLAEQGEDTRLLTMTAERMYFKKRKDKKNASLYTGALSVLYGFIQILSEEIARLDKGATQQSSKRILEILARQMGYEKDKYKDSCPAYASLCNGAEESLLASINDTVYANDLRYTLCELSMGYLDLAKAFAL